MDALKEAGITVRITTRPAIVALGTAVSFAATVDCPPGIDDTVTWYIVNSVTDSSIDSITGELTVGENETATAITIRAVSNYYPAKYDEWTANVIPAQVRITTPTTSVPRGTSETFQAVLERTDNGSTADLDQTITWSIISPDPVPAGVSIDANTGLLTVDSDTTAKSVTIQAKSAATGLTDTKVVETLKNQDALNITSPNTHWFGTPYTITSAGGSGTGAVTYQIISGGTGAGSISGNTLTVTTAGTFILRATKAGDDDYNPTTSPNFTLTVNIPQLNSIAITTQASIRNYTRGQTLNTSGMVVTAYWSDGTSSVVTATTSPAHGAVLNTNGTITVTVSYTPPAGRGTTKTTSYTVSVTEPPSVGYINVGIIGSSSFFFSPYVTSGGAVTLQSSSLVSSTCPGGAAFVQIDNLSAFGAGRFTVNLTLRKAGDGSTRTVQVTVDTNGIGGFTVVNNGAFNW